MREADKEIIRAAGRDEERDAVIVFLMIDSLVGVRPDVICITYICTYTA